MHLEQFSSERLFAGIDTQFAVRVREYKVELGRREVGLHSVLLSGLAVPYVPLGKQKNNTVTLSSRLHDASYSEQGVVHGASCAPYISYNT